MATSAPYGPNTRLVDRFLVRIANAPTLHWLDAVKNWSDTPERDGEEALAALARAIEHPSIHPAATRVRERVQEYAESIEWAAHFIVPDMRRELIERAASVATQAAWALMLRGDRLTEEHLIQLYAPWGQFIPLFSLERDG